MSGTVSISQTMMLLMITTFNRRAGRKSIHAHYLGEDLANFFSRQRMDARACEIGMQKGPPFRGDRLPIGTPEQRVHTGFPDSWKPRLGCWSWRRLQRSAARFLSKASPSKRSAGSWAYLGRS